MRIINEKSVKIFKTLLTNNVAELDDALKWEDEVTDEDRIDMLKDYQDLLDTMDSLK